MKRCTKCILPQNYPEITFDKEGVCNYCARNRERKYLGDEALRKKIDTILESKRDRNESYACVLGLSGGRDSSYLLYYLVKVLGLPTVSCFVDNGFAPEQTRLNIQNMVHSLGVELVVREHDALKRCVRYHMQAWMHKPAPATVGLLCTGCRLGIDVGLNRFARQHKIPIVIAGATPFEGFSFKTRIFAPGPSKKKRTSFVLGYLAHAVENPRWLMNPTCLLVQAREYYWHYFLSRRKQKDPTWIAPFRHHVKWDERKIVSTIEDEFDWQKNPQVESTWRGDCDIALLKLYLYKQTLGYNDKDEGLSHLIRDGQISRTEALERLEKEGDTPTQVIAQVMDKLGLSFPALQAALERYRSAH